MFDLSTIMTALGMAGGGAVWLVKQDRRISGTKTRLADHEDSCGQRYKSINETMQRIERRLENQDQVSDERHAEAQEHRQALAQDIGKLNTTVAALEENRRMRERFEDRDDRVA